MLALARRKALVCLGLLGWGGAVLWWAAGQTASENGKQSKQPDATVIGFADVVQERRQQVVADSSFPSSLPSDRTQWLQFLQSLHLRPPERPEGWKFSTYSWRRWRGALASRGGFVRRWQVRTMEATAYCPKGCCGSATGRTATGRRAEYGIAAVDPRVIPLGTALYVDRYGFAIAADVGRAIKGNRIDLCFPTHREAHRFGRRWVRVLILH
jgi:3D (Asp-Asp-Asp) domain-containing protein